ncbi:MAG: hypothetical protein EOP10_35390, partial [Proteobacteria bacterium]
MAIGKINRSLYVRALLGVVWASSISAQGADFTNSGDLLRAMPKSVGVMADLDPMLPREVKDSILDKVNKKSSKTAARAIDNAEEDAILAEAERLLHNELLDHKTLTTSLGGLPSSALAAGNDVRIRLSLVDGKLRMEPAVLDLSLNGGEASVTVDGLSAVPQVFLRDASRLQWDGKRFHALAQGKTEIFFVYANEMYILPVRIGAPNKDLLADLASERLSGLKMPEGFAQMPGDAAGPRNSADLSIAEASLQVVRTKSNEDNAQKRFVYAAEAPGYRDTAIQVMDVRSEPRDGKIFP